MSLKPRTKVSRWRFVRAYTVTFQILSKYILLFLVRKIIGAPRAEGLMTRSHAKTARQIIHNILKLKGLYIKIGQTLSIMTNFLPEELTSGLEELQDAVPPHPIEDVEKRFMEDFGKKPSEIFAKFEETPIASASLAQVHVAYLANGKKLAVKLQYPEIDRLVVADLKTIKRIFGFVDFFFPGYGLKEVYRESAKIILQELDLTTEGKNLEKIRDNFAGHPQYVFPKIYWEYSSPKILTAEFVEGIKVTNVELLKKTGIDPHDVAVSLIHMYCKQIFKDGVYHADPHPGNIIVVPNPPQGGFQIALVDYGATATITPQIRGGITLFVEGLIKKDTRLLSTAMKQMGFVARAENEEAFDKIVDYFYGKIKGIKIENFRELNISQFQNLGDILEFKKMDISLRELSTTFHVPKDWILLERALILMMGLTAHLDPRLNPTEIVLPYVEEFVLGKDKNAAELILQASKEILLSYINLPAEIHKTLKKLQDGKISVNNKWQKEHTQKVYHAVHQLIYALFTIFCGSLAFYFSEHGNMEWMTRMKYATSFFLAILGLSFLRHR